MFKFCIKYYVNINMRYCVNININRVINIISKLKFKLVKYYRNYFLKQSMI